jgi:hypothetical protein
MKKILFLFFIVAVQACGVANKTQSSAGSTAFKVSENAPSDDYGSESNPIKVSTGSVSADNEYRFLALLAGPNGEAVTYNRKGSCCAFKTPNGLINNTGLLDHFVVKIAGDSKEYHLYINMYDNGKMYIPKGFKAKR